MSLPDEAVVGFEALARWPDLLGCSPDLVFAHANAVGALDTLDHLCITAAIAAALDSPLSRGSLLCVNAEPATPYVGRGDDVVIALGHEGLTVMFEITERNVLAHPRALLRKVAAARADGFAIALDDVGAQPHSLSLLDVILPDVIKLDLSLVQSQPSHAQAQTLDAVLAHHDRTDAVILAEGIETEEHREQALALGATLGQGFLFGHPGPLNYGTAASWSTSERSLPHSPGPASPFDLIAGISPTRTARKDTLVALSRRIETQAGQSADPPMVFTALQRGEYFSGETRTRYHGLADNCPLVAIFGQGIPKDLGSGVRGTDLDPTDPLCTEWTVVALGPHSATALIAREHPNHRAEPEDDDSRRFDYVITYDRSLVTAAARGLLDRMQ